MPQDYPIALAASLVAAGVTTAGVLVVRRHAAWGRSNATYFAAFAAGVLIAVSFLHIIPTAFSMNANAPVWLLAGFLAMYAINRFVTAFVCDRPGSEDAAFGLVPMLGIGFHSFIDGIVYSVAFTVSALTGTLTAVGMVLHEFPEGIVTYVLLLRGGFAPRTALWLSLAAAAATTPLGTALSHPLIAHVDKETLGALLALSAGSLVYVGATHLLCRVEREPRRFSLVAMVAGISVAVGIIASHV